MHSPWVWVTVIYVFVAIGAFKALLTDTGEAVPTVHTGGPILTWIAITTVVFG